MKFRQFAFSSSKKSIRRENVDFARKFEIMQSSNFARRNSIAAKFQACVRIFLLSAAKSTKNELWWQKSDTPDLLSVS